MQKHVFDENQPKGIFSGANFRNNYRALFQGDSMPLRARAALVLDDMEYPSDAAAQAEWSGVGVTVSTNSVDKQEGNYCLQCVIDASGDRQVTNEKSLNLSGFINIKLWERCNQVSSNIQFLLRDNLGNESYWNITTDVTPNTWKQDSLNLSAPDGNNGSPADLANIVRFGFKGLDSNATYLFDTTKVICGMNVAVGPADIASFYKQVWVGSQPLNFIGGASPTITNPSSNPRIDILHIDSSGTLAWTTGTEAASPTPNWLGLPAGVLIICLVYCKPLMTKIVDYEDKDSYPNDGYIYADCRPFLNIGGIPVDETLTDTKKDKLVSNNLAKGWQDHKNASNPHSAHATKPHGNSEHTSNYSVEGHAHVEADITDLDHNAQKIKSKTVDAPLPGDDGKALVYDHANSKYKHAGLVGIPANMQAFISSGTWTRPAGVSKVWVKVWGGGGRGGAGGAQGGSPRGGGAGGAGAYAEGLVSVTGDVPVTVGAGGEGANPGGASSFGASVVAGGGNNGQDGYNGGAAGSGGTATAGDIQINGGAGDGGGNPNGGSGGGCPLGGSGGTGGPEISTGGTPGRFPGGGGGGGGASAPSPPPGGGPGAVGSAGLVIVYW